VPVLPRGVPGGRHHLQGRAPPPADLKRYHLASEAFQDALDRDPDYSDALIGLGSAQFELGRYEEALGPLEKALRRKVVFRTAGQELPDAHAKLAWSLYYLGRYDAALAAFGEALRAAPDGHGLHNGMGWTYLRLGRKMEAQAAFRRALALQPDYEDAREGLRRASG
jgi:protein O-GlcNAc transferase